MHLDYILTFQTAHLFRSMWSVISTYNHTLPCYCVQRSAQCIKKVKFFCKIQGLWHPCEGLLSQKTGSKAETLTQSLIHYHLVNNPASCYQQYLVLQAVKNLPAMQETRVWSLGQEDPLAKGMATHPSLLAWRIPWTEEPGWLQSVGLQRIGHAWATNTLLLSISE